MCQKHFGREADLQFQCEEPVFLLHYTHTKDTHDLATCKYTVVLTHFHRRMLDLVPCPQVIWAKVFVSGLINPNTHIYLCIDRESCLICLAKSDCAHLSPHCCVYCLLISFRNDKAVKYRHAPVALDFDLVFTFSFAERWVQVMLALRTCSEKNPFQKKQRNLFFLKTGAWDEHSDCRHSCTCANAHVQACLFTNTDADVWLGSALGRARHESSVGIQKSHVTETAFIVFCAVFCWLMTK